MSRFSLLQKKLKFQAVSLLHSLFLFAKGGEVIFQFFRQAVVAGEARRQGDEAEAVVFVAFPRDFSGEYGPHFFHRTAVPKGGGFVQIPVEAGVHVAVGVELAAQAGASRFVLPKEEKVPVFEIGHQGAVV